MEIVKTISADTATLAVAGKLSAATADEFGAAVDIALGEAKNIVLDFKELSYLASAGLRVLLSTQKKLKASGGTLCLLHVCEEVMEVFEITGLNDVLDIR
ncbi:MAG: STAS domain-containing protein [Treponema sp.]|jgi:anti-sigma B factor antagonist|nr:STAS domain-containing protein [Treponema sp.]